MVLGFLSANADWKDDIGYTQLLQTFPGEPPNTVVNGVAQIEAGTSYLPDNSNPSSPEFSGKIIVNKSGVAGYSGHATSVAQTFYGNLGSIIPATSAIDVYSANPWLESGFLNYGAAFAPPLPETRRVQNHSWIAIYPREVFTLPQIQGAVENIGQRLDFAINRDGFISVVGVNNGTSTTLPDLLCQTYHTLAVGLVNGQHSAGLTEFDVTGRMKPDLVAFNPFTSFAAPQVAGAAGLLSEKIRATTLTPALATADFPRLTKALLLAGATKEPLAAWSRASTAKPYDATSGAGALNILLPYRMFVSGRQPATNSALVADTGWDTNSVSSGTTQTYFFEIPASSASPRLSAALTWHRTVNYNNFFNTFSSSLRNLDLRLFSVTPGTFTVGTQLDASLSTVDNVEHLYQATLAPGRYALRVSVTGGTSISYALAWRTSPTVTIAATAAEAREFDGTQGQFTLTRTGQTTTPLYVPLATGGTAVSGTHYAAMPAGVLIPAGSASATVQVVPVADALAQGDRTVTLSVATDFSLSAGSPAAASVILADKPYDAWRFAKFTAPQLATPSISDPTADPDADGIPNLLEYAFAREPFSTDFPAVLPAVAVGHDDRLTLTYFQATDRPDLVFTPEWTPDLTGTWQNSATFLTEISRTATAGGETVTVRAETTLTTAPSQFLRLRVTRP